MKIAVVDDHVLVREALRGVVGELAPDALVVDAADCRQARIVFEDHPDLQLLLLDLNLPDGDGLSLLAHVREHHSATSIVILSAMQDRESVLRALDLGAAGFIPKSATREVIVNALRLIMAGGTYIPPEALSRTLAQGTNQPADRSIQPTDLGLTDRQQEVLALMMKGKSNKWICRSLDLAEPTVKHHVTAILKALKVTNRTEAVLAVTALGWELPDVN